jgi:prepilin-type processing-associated H-X9-DG protein
MPPSIDHIAAMVPGGGGGILTCPACGSNPAKPPVTAGTTVSANYYYIPPAPRLTQLKPAATTVIAYEPPSNHDNRSMALLFADGHAEVITGPTMQKIAIELAAGQNPPPSKK